MTEIVRCDACKGDCVGGFLLLQVSDSNTFGNRPDRHFHDEECLRDWLDGKRQRSIDTEKRAQAFYAAKAPIP